MHRQTVCAFFDIKVHIMKKLLFSLLAVAVCLPLMAGIRQKKADKDTNEFRYEIECAGNAVQGT